MFHVSILNRVQGHILITNLITITLRETPHGPISREISEQCTRLKNYTVRVVFFFYFFHFCETCIYWSAHSIILAVTLVMGSSRLDLLRKDRRGQGRERERESEEVGSGQPRGRIAKKGEVCFSEKEAPKLPNSFHVRANKCHPPSSPSSVVVGPPPLSMNPNLLYSFMNQD